MYKPPKLITQKNSIKSPLQMEAPGGWYLEIVLKYKAKRKVKQSNYVDSNISIFVFGKELLRVPNDWSQKVLQFIAVYEVHSTLSASISLVHIDKVLALLRFRKVYVLKASFSKTFLQITDINFLPIIS